MKLDPLDPGCDPEPLYSRDDDVTIIGVQIVADKPTFLHCRMKPEYLATLDELVAHHEQDDRSSMIRLMIKDYRERMNRIKAKRAKEKTE